jgi:WD40 repeat protein
MRILQNTAEKDVKALAFTHDGGLVAGGNCGFDVWPLPEGVRIHIPSDRTAHVYGCGAAPGREWFYYSSYDSCFRAFRLDGGESRQLPGPESHSQHVLALAASTDGRLAVSRDGATANRVECWLVAGWHDWRLAWCLRDGHLSDRIDDRPKAGRQETWHSAVAFSPDGATLAVVEGRPTTEVYHLALRDAATGRLRSEIATELFLSRIPLHFTRDGTRLVTMKEARLDLWDIARGEHVLTAAAPGRAHFWAMAVHPSGRFLATAGGDGAVRYWGVDSLREVRSFKWGVGKLHSVAFNADGSLGAAGGGKGKVVLWDVDD